ncbi:hypothetical protein F4861DRAFT_243876 [Xylaria intraflava]|nr:hypothetical protein F4861DRAFT_243876 [Xylaria intraflava]
MAPEVSVYTTPPKALVEVLTKFRIPYSLPLIRRLRFTGFPGGCTQHTRILWSSRLPVEEYPASHEAGAGAGARSSPGTEGEAGPVEEMIPFAAAYLDFSREPETELWLYSSLEVTAAESDDIGVQEDREEEEEGRKIGAPGRARAEQGEDEAFECLVALLREVKREQDLYFVPGSAQALAREFPTVLVGNLNEVLREHLVTRGVSIVSTGLYDKWIFRVDGLPPVREPAVLGGRPCLWDVVRREDIMLTISRTNIQRRERTMKLLPSRALYLEDGTLIAWAFLGPDSSLSSLHCEEPYRGRGIAKAVAVKLLRDRIREYGDDGYAWADVAPDNTQSQGVCKGLNGQVKWQISWSHLDLNQSFPDE